MLSETDRPPPPRNDLMADSLIYCRSPLEWTAMHSKSDRIPPEILQRFGHNLLLARQHARSESARLLTRACPHATCGRRPVDSRSLFLALLRLAPVPADSSRAPGVLAL